MYKSKGGLHENDKSKLGGNVSQHCVWHGLDIKHGIQMQTKVFHDKS